MPLWPKLTTTLFLLILLPIYWREYGPANFLWFSDVALFLLVLALWLESRFLTSMAALAVLLPELLWSIEFLLRLITGIRLLGTCDYMFDPTRPLFLRALSLFHLALPPLLLWMLHRLGYESRGKALQAQTLLAWIILLASYWISTPEQNINWVLGPSPDPQRWMHPLAYLALLMLFVPLAIYLPTHLLLRALFRPR